MTALATIATWLGPVLIASLAARVFTGDPQAPLIAVLAVVAPLVALLRRGPAVQHRRASDFTVALVTTPGVAAIVCANLLVVVELARLHGIARTPALAVGVVLALTPLVVGGADDAWAGVISALGIVAAVAALVVVATAIGVSPWTAWSRIASRPAVVFDDRSVWVTEGRSLPDTTTLMFSESHRVIAMTPGTYRLVDHDGARGTVQERRLEPGDSVMLRPGDALVVPAGARIRFEAGRRVPGALASGVAWSQPREPSRVSALAHALGVAVAMVGGALAVVATPSAMTTVLAVGAPVALLVAALSATAWGVYAMYAAPDLSMSAGPLAALVQLAPVVVDHDWAAGIVSVVGVALLALFTAAACGLWHRTRRAWSGCEHAIVPGLVWAVVCVAAAAASPWLADAWTVLLAGLGLLASTVAAPSLANGGLTGERAGAVLGGIAYVAIAGAATTLGWPSGVAGATVPAAVIAFVAARVAGEEADIDEEADPASVAAATHR